MFRYPRFRDDTPGSRSACTPFAPTAPESEWMAKWSSVAKINKLALINNQVNILNLIIYPLTPTCIICNRCFDGFRMDPPLVVLFSPPQHLSLTVAVDTSSELMDRSEALSDGCWWPLWMLMLLFMRKLLPRCSVFCSTWAAGGCWWQWLHGLFWSPHWRLGWVSWVTQVALISIEMWRILKLYAILVPRCSYR